MEKVPTRPRVRNRRGEGERLREQLIDAASELIAESLDAGSLSLRAVAARAGVAAPSVYLHFKDIDAIRMAVANRSFAAFTAARIAASAGALSATESLITGCHVYARYALSNPGHYRLMFGADLPAITGEQGTANQEAFDNLVGSIRRCQTEGVARTDMSPDRVALMVWSALHGHVSLRIDRPHMPWPPLDPLITDLVARLVGLQRSERSP